MKRDWTEEERKAARNRLIANDDTCNIHAPGVVRVYLDSAERLQCENTFLAEQVKEAHDLLNILANGKNPATGEINWFGVHIETSEQALIWLDRNKESL